MFSGGTNFGFFSGALTGTSLTPRPGTLPRYIAHTTSYDEDALVSENGLPTEKYYLCRDVLAEQLGKEKNPSRELPFEYKLQTPKIELTEAARLFDNLDALTEKIETSVGIKSFEQLGAPGGLVLYETEFEGWSDCGKRKINIGGLADRATLYDGENYIGTTDRDRIGDDIYTDAADRTVLLRALCECVARINGGKNLDNDPKGIKYITFDNAKLYNYKMRIMPMKRFDDLKYKPLGAPRDNDPTFFRGFFDAETGVDTFLDMRGWGRGFVLVNGFNIGRFWNIGPQYTLYVPGGLLKEKNNEIVIFDINHSGEIKLSTRRDAILEGE